MDHQLAALLRRVDPDRFFCTLLAPKPARDRLFTLYAFDHELARASIVASQPTLVLIRLQWWREVVEGARRRHEVATPLSAALATGELDRDECLRMIEGREREAEGAMPDLVAFESYCMAAHGSVMAAAGLALGCGETATLRRLGAGCGAVWVLRRRRGLLPPEPVEDLAREWLVAPPRGERCAAILPAVLARRDLRRPEKPRLLWDQLAVLAQSI